MRTQALDRTDVKSWDSNPQISAAVYGRYDSLCTIQELSTSPYYGPITIGNTTMCAALAYVHIYTILPYAAVIIFNHHLYCIGTRFRVDPCTHQTPIPGQFRRQSPK